MNHTNELMPSISFSQWVKSRLRTSRSPATIPIERHYRLIQITTKSTGAVKPGEGARSDLAGFSAIVCELRPFVTNEKHGCSTACIGQRSSFSFATSVARILVSLE